MEKKKNVYFAQPWGGLGDNFVFSNLPRLYDNIGIGFNLSFLNYERNSEIKKTVWKSNPFVKSKLSLNYPNIGSRKLNKFEIKEHNLNVVQKINIYHGFEKGDGYPDIYLEKDELPSLKYQIVIDFNAFSMFNTQETIYDLDKLLELRFELNNPDSYFLNYPNLYKTEETKENLISSDSINDLIEILLSTETFYCLNSGSHCLAAVLKKNYGYPKKIVSYLPNLELNDLYSFGHVYENVDYLSTPGLKNDNISMPRKMRIYTGLIKKYFNDTDNY